MGNWNILFLLQRLTNGMITASQSNILLKWIQFYVCLYINNIYLVSQNLRSDTIKNIVGLYIASSNMLLWSTIAINIHRLLMLRKGVLLTINYMHAQKQNLHWNIELHNLKCMYKGNSALVFCCCYVIINNT